MFDIIVYGGSALAFLVWLQFGAPGVALAVSAVQAVTAKIKGLFTK